MLDESEPEPSMPELSRILDSIHDPIAKPSRKFSWRQMEIRKRERAQIENHQACYHAMHCVKEAMHEMGQSRPLPGDTRKQALRLNILDDLQTIYMQIKRWMSASGTGSGRPSKLSVEGRMRRLHEMVDRDEAPEDRVIKNKLRDMQADLKAPKQPENTPDLGS